MSRQRTGRKSLTHWLMNEKNIVRLLGWNLQMGFRMLLKEYKDPIYWHIRRITVNSEDAQDATQETFIRVFRSFGQYDRSRSFTAWLYRIATNEALRIIEKRHPTVDVESNVLSATRCTRKPSRRFGAVSVALAVAASLALLVIFSWNRQPATTDSLAEVQQAFADLDNADQEFLSDIYNEGTFMNINY